ncbi:MAG: DUF1844 domain-containing protein [Deltaproteobacteria bacterium]|jgi:hypothetical protein|nr:DUF1844 domain-containing protein [Deltaproteobacteria bacterium]
MSEITVNDRRMFNKDGELKEPAPESSSGSAEAKGSEELKNPAPNAAATEAESADGFDQMPPPSFSSLVIGLATSVMMHMGEHSPDGADPAQKPNLPAAKNIIDLLGVLEQKTKGNLEREEEELFKAVLYDLRMNYVNKTRK